MSKKKDFSEIELPTTDSFSASDISLAPSQSRHVVDSISSNRPVIRNIEVDKIDPSPAQQLTYQTTPIAAIAAKEHRMPAADPAKTHEVKAFKHASPLISCRFDPSGRYLFAGAQDSRIWRWEVAGEGKVELSAHDSWVRGMAFHGDGKTLVGEGQKSGVYHALFANDENMEYAWSTVVGPPLFAANAASAAVEGRNIYTTSSPPGQTFALAKDSGSYVLPAPVPERQIGPIRFVKAPVVWSAHAGLLHSVASQIEASKPPSWTCSAAPAKPGTTHVAITQRTAAQQVTHARGCPAFMSRSPSIRSLGWRPLYRRGPPTAAVFCPRGLSARSSAAKRKEFATSEDSLERRCPVLWLGLRLRSHLDACLRPCRS